MNMIARCAMGLSDQLPPDIRWNGQIELIPGNVSQALVDLERNGNTVDILTVQMGRDVLDKDLLLRKELEGNVLVRREFPKIMIEFVDRWNTWATTDGINFWNSAIPAVASYDVKLKQRFDSVNQQQPLTTTLMQPIVTSAGRELNTYLSTEVALFNDVMAAVQSFTPEEWIRINGTNVTRPSNTGLTCENIKVVSQVIMLKNMANTSLPIMTALLCDYKPKTSQNQLDAGLSGYARTNQSNRRLNNRSNEFVPNRQVTINPQQSNHTQRRQSD